jgi:hypothetical protein
VCRCLHACKQASTHTWRGGEGWDGQEERDACLGNRPATAGALRWKLLRMIGSGMGGRGGGRAHCSHTRTHTGSSEQGQRAMHAAFVACGTRGDVQPIACLAEYSRRAAICYATLITHAAHALWLSQPPFSSVQMVYIDSSPHDRDGNEGQFEHQQAVWCALERLRPAVIVFNLFALEVCAGCMHWERMRKGMQLETRQNASTCLHLSPCVLASVHPPSSASMLPGKHRLHLTP